MKAIDAVRMALQFAYGGMRALQDMKADPLVQPGPWGGNHAMWIAGHLTVVEGRLHKVLRGTPNPVEHWKPLFDWGSEPKPTRRPIRRLRKCCRRFDACVKERWRSWTKSATTVWTVQQNFRHPPVWAVRGRRWAQSS